MPRPAGGADPRLSPRRAKARAVPPEAFYLGHPMAPRRHSSSGPPSSAQADETLRTQETKLIAPRVIHGKYNEILKECMRRF
ncbi:hypothetical protein DIPPA_27850 [Diplonema papillatum]|nr:hypothetical protein DIPPA_27850 [Diplonema papillatum]